MSMNEPERLARAVEACNQTNNNCPVHGRKAADAAEGE